MRISIEDWFIVKCINNIHGWDKYSVVLHIGKGESEKNVILAFLLQWNVLIFKFEKISILIAI